MTMRTSIPSTSAGSSATIATGGFAEPEAVHAGVDVYDRRQASAGQARLAPPFLGLAQVVEHRNQAVAAKLARACRQWTVEDVNLDTPAGRENRSQIDALIECGDEEGFAAGAHQRWGYLGRAQAVGVGLHDRGALGAGQVGSARGGSWRRSRRGRSLGPPLPWLEPDIGKALGAIEVVKLRGRAVELQLYHARRPVALLADDDLGDVVHAVHVLLPLFHAPRCRVRAGGARGNTPRGK